MSRHRSRTRSAIIALLVLLVAAAPAGASQRDDLQAALDDVVAAGAPGVVALARDDSGTWAGAAGVADVATGRPLQPDLRFRVGSLAKPFVATVVLQLVDEGAIGLDQPVAAVLPGVLPDGDAITVRHLLQHTSGIPDYVGVLSDPDDPRAVQRVWRPAELVAAVADAPRHFPPGSDWRYSNTGYALLGMFVEAVTGDRLERVLAERITRPLGLDDTWLPVAARGLGGPHAAGLSIPLDEDGQPAGPPRDATHDNPSMAWAAGGLVSTAADLAAFEAALLDGELLPADLLAQMRSTVDTGGDGTRYGLGLMEQDLPCGTAAGHDGGIAGYSSAAFTIPDNGRQAVVLVNTDALTTELSAAVWNAVTVALCGSEAG